MLNLILANQRPQSISRVSGIPVGWRHSPYNQRTQAQQELFSLVEQLDARFVLISYNSEGFVKQDAFLEHLSKLGNLQILTTDYNTFRASRNLNQRDIHVKEYLFLLEKSR